MKQISLNADKLSDYQHWKEANSDDFSLWDYLFAVTDVEIAIAFTKLFWPNFVEQDGGIFLAEVFEIELYEQLKAELGEEDITAIERALNQQHIDEMLPGAEKVGAENVLYLGQAIAQMWDSRLKSLYPQRRFQVECKPNEFAVSVTFYQIRDE